MVSFPLVKLGVLAAKQISQPIIKVIKQTATKNTNFQTYLVSPIAQTYHWIGVRSKMRMLGMKQPKYIPPLNRTMAIETGSNLLGELIVFSIGVSLILLEFKRQARNDQLKHEKHREKRESLKNEITVLHDRVLSQNQEIRKLKTLLIKLSSSPLQ